MIYIVFMVIKDSTYHAPACVIDYCLTGSIICTSPEDGALEGIDYEDLVI